MSHRPEWLADRAGALIDELGRTQAPHPHFDVVVVGSGYGGAVAAARFARATRPDGTSEGEPLKVCVLERGAEYVPGSFPARISDVPWHVRLSRPDDADIKGRADGLYDFRIGTDVSALVGNGLGGGSLINAGVVEAPEDDVFEDAHWPSALRRDRDELKKMFGEAVTMLGAKHVDDMHLAKHEQLGKFARAARLRAVPVKVAVQWDRTGEDEAVIVNAQGVEQKRCRRCGDCVTGCNFKAKNTLPMNYLAAAKAHGASLYIGVTVCHVRKCDGYWEVHWRRTGTQHPNDKDQVDESLDRTHVMRARHVVLSAGTFGSTEILLRSRAQGLHVSGKLGKRFSTNGDMISVLYAQHEKVNAAPKEHQPFAEREVGPTITGMLKSGDSRKNRVVVEELAVPGALRRLFEEIVTTGALPVQLGRMDWSRHRATGDDPAAVDDARIERTQIFAAMGDDGSVGSLELVEGWTRPDAGPDGAIRIDWKDAGKAPIYEVQDKLLAKSERLGGMYLRSPLWKPLPEPLASMLSGEKPEGKLFTVHPLGGCPMGEDWKEGVVDDLGRVYDPSEPGDLARVHTGLLVLDGSIIPVALGINPLLTIAGVAERAVRRYIEIQGWDAHEDRQAQVKRQPDKVVNKSGETPDKAVTAVRFAERMKGPLRLSRFGEEHETALDVTFDPIGEEKEIASFLREGPHRVKISDGTLTVSVQSERRRKRELARERRRAAWIQKLRRKILDSAQPGEDGRKEMNRRLRELWERVRGRERAREQKRASTLNQVQVPVSGWVQWMERAPSCAGTRTVRALIAWLKTRALADFYVNKREHGFWKALKKSSGFFALIRLASNIGETRYLRYGLELREDLLLGGELVLPRGTCVDGLKTFRYGHGANPWQQLSRLAVTFRAPGSLSLSAGTLEIDLRHLVERFTAMFQITRQLDQPTAMLDVASIGLYMLRIVLKLHFWSFRAPEYEKFDPERARRRLPGPLKHLGFEQWPVWVARKDRQGRDKPPLSLILTRYKGAPRGRVPVMLVHGFGSGGVQFAHPDLPNNLVRALVRAGHDVWVAELRTSIALPSSRNQWTLDEVATEDIPALVDEIRNRTGQEKVDVVAHCIGSAMFCTAVLGVEDLHQKIRSATLLQVGPLITLSPGNRFRGYVAAAMRRYMLTDHVDSSIDSRATALDTIIDRVLATYPYPEAEQERHNLWPPCEAHTHIANCNRSAAVFSRLMQHEKVSTKTLDLLGDMIGHTNLKTFEQTGQYAFAERLTDSDACNLYVTDENVLQRFRFPVRFLHGEKNDVFAVETSHRSLRLLQDVFRGRHFSDVVMLEGYGHLDPLIGDKAHEEVFPKITEFLAGDAGRGNTKVTEELRHSYPRRPLIGPILGWTRAENGQRIARIWCRTDDEKSYAYFLIAVVLDGSGRHHGVFMQRLRDEQGDRPHGGLDVLGVIDVPLPAGNRDWEVVVLGAHRSSTSNMSVEPAEMFTRPKADIEAARTKQMAQASAVQAPAQFPEVLRTEPLPPAYGDAVIAERDAWKGALKKAGQARRVEHPGYFERLDSVVVSGEVLRRLGDRGNDIMFALGCCRFSASLIDRERADSSFGVLRELIDPARKHRLPLTLLLLLGDQIYADATAGMFDPKNRRGRFNDSYREVWTAANAREVLRRLPTYMMMDDHEVADDWHPEDRPDRLVKGLRDAKDWGLIAFEDYQLLHSPWKRPVAQGTLATRKPVGKYWYDFESGGFHFFVCDTRSTREGRARIISGEQMAALKAWLTDPNRPRDGRPLFVVSPSVVLPESRTKGADDWSGFSESLQDLFGYIAANEHQGLRNVVFLCGDSHLAMNTKITLPGKASGRCHCLCIAGTPLYAPMPFANAHGEDAWDKHDVDLGGGRILHYERDENSVAEGDGVTTVGARLEGGRWRITVDLYQRLAGDLGKVQKRHSEYVLD